MGVVVLVVSNLSGATHGVLLLGRVVAAVVVGGAVYGGVAFVLGRRAAERQHHLQRLAKQSRRLVARHRAN